MTVGKQDRAGTLYRRNRQYDLITGRFTQEDPIGLAGGVNLYGFGNADPVNYSDPFGLCPDGCVVEGGVGLYVLGVGTVAAFAAAAHGEELGAALGAGIDAGRDAISGIVSWAKNKQQVSHIKGKLDQIDVHFGKLAGLGGPDDGDPNDPKNRDKWKGDIRRAIKQIREHIEKINGDRNKAQWEKATQEAEKRLTNIPRE